MNGEDLIFKILQLMFWIVNITSTIILTIHELKKPKKASSKKRKKKARKSKK